MRNMHRMHKMAESDNICKSCITTTKYKCINCKVPSCVPCSVFETNEETLGWKPGKSVAYCATCFNKKMVYDHDEIESEDESQSNTLTYVGHEDNATKSASEKKYTRFVTIILMLM